MAAASSAGRTAGRAPRRGRAGRARPGAAGGVRGAPRRRRGSARAAPRRERPGHIASRKAPWPDIQRPAGRLPPPGRRPRSAALVSCCRGARSPRAADRLGRRRPRRRGRGARPRRVPRPATVPGRGGPPRRPPERLSGDPPRGPHAARSARAEARRGGGGRGHRGRRAGARGGRPAPRARLDGGGVRPPAEPPLPRGRDQGAAHRARAGPLARRAGQLARLPGRGAAHRPPPQHPLRPHAARRSGPGARADDPLQPAPAANPHPPPRAGGAHASTSRTWRARWCTWSITRTTRP